MKKYSRSERKKMVARRAEEREQVLNLVEFDAISRFVGQLPELSSALGMLRMGDHLGWRSLVLIHSKKTIRKYEDILGITVREFFPEVGPMSQRHVGFVLASKLSNFWKVVSGEEKIEGRQLIQ